jgi:hypothetical protein
MRRVLAISLLMCCIPLASLPWNIPEKLTFQIKYGMITAGEATLEISQSTYNDSIPVYRIISRAETNSFFDTVYKVRDNIESIWDADNLVSLRFTKKLREGTYRQHRKHFYYPQNSLSVYMKQNRKTKEWKTQTMEIPAQTQDILSAFYWARTQQLTPGDSLLINVTVDGRSNVAKVVVHGIEEMDTIFGTKRCIKIEPLVIGESLFKQTGAIYIWLTDDEQKIPVLLESKIIFGHFRAILTNAE